MNTMSLHRPRGGLSTILATIFIFFIVTTSHAAPPPVPDDTGPTTETVITTVPATTAYAPTANLGDLMTYTSQAPATSTGSEKSGPAEAAGTLSNMMTSTSTGTWVPADLQTLLKGHQAPDYPTAATPAPADDTGHMASIQPGHIGACVREGPSNQLVPS